MYFLIAGCVLFFVTHLYTSVRTRDPARDIRVRLGPAKYMAIYSVFAGLGFVLMVWGYGLARPSPALYTPPAWGAHVNLALMLPALILLFAAYAPLGYIKNAVKHPMVLGVILWSFGHLLANGELNSVILFGSFLAYALIDRILVMGRPVKIPAKPPSLFADIYAVCVGAAVYFLFYKYLHAMMIGVPVIA